MIFSRVHILIIFQLFLVFTLITSASAKGKSTTKPTQKSKPTKDNSIKPCVYQTPAGFANDPVATKSKYTVIVTSGSIVSTPVYDLKMAVVACKIPQKNDPLKNVKEHAPCSRKMARRILHKGAWKTARGSGSLDFLQL
ncbi:hypothetical protein BPAE_0124g00140 [Botrytis paeoniae]|uniref:Uncharacterized protein n=1 Tax=Botrytis paeoniae TaxID=278948 RepID=A0A4Z1FLI5_9HELO|nr:hypothetical protein BPAE_0124g00140 [Botrytis paeoniae]